MCEINKLVDEVIQYQERNTKLQARIDFEKHCNGLIHEDISFLKNHIQNLTTQINELKIEKQCNQQIVQDFKRKFNKKLLEKDEESSLLRNFIKKLFEQIKMLTDVKPENIPLENKDDKSNVSNQCDQESQDNKETKEATIKLCSDKEKI